MIARTIACIALAIACVLSTSGCVTTAGGTLGELGRSSMDASSDVKSARLALRLFESGESTVAATDTALGDALTNLTGTQSSVSTMSVSTARERAARRRANADIAAAVNAINSAQGVVERVPGAPSAAVTSARLAATAQTLTRLASSLRVSS